MSELDLSVEDIHRFDRKGPRYTSYPTAPHWDEMCSETYGVRLGAFGGTGREVSLYVHVPFCEKRCWYCACNVVVHKKKGSIADTYLDYLSKECAGVVRAMGARPVVKQIHLGGGTPTFLTSDQRKRLQAILHEFFDLSGLAQASIEVDPRTVTEVDIQELYELGFNRLSFGVQDLDPDVQKHIGRIQPFELVKQVVDTARAVGFQGINVDLIYGLPGQTLDRFSETIASICSIQPDRIALYSFAHMPELFSHQRLIPEAHMPTADEKIALFLQARQTLIEQGYMAIAMDHFARQDDELAIAYQTGTLKRNFMGYTTLATEDYIGLGVSSIGYLGNGFSQNIKDLKDYYAALDKGHLPIDRGYALSERDLICQWVINHLMCQFEVQFSDFHARFNQSFLDTFSDRLPAIHQHQADGLLTLEENALTLSHLGRLFVRNVCMSFDDFLNDPSAKKSTFSQTI